MSSSRAGRVGRRRLRAAEQLVLALAAQDEGVLVDVVADLHVVAVRPHAAGGHRAACRRACRPSRCAIGCMRSVELAARRASKSAAVYGLTQREGATPGRARSRARRPTVRPRARTCQPAGASKRKPRPATTCDCAFGCARPPAACEDEATARRSVCLRRRRRGIRRAVTRRKDPASMAKTKRQGLRRGGERQTLRRARDARTRSCATT